MIESTSWLFNKPVAHRGLHNEKFPENSLGAFQNAVDNGFPIETDIHLSIDGELVVFHDDSLKRMTGDERTVEDVMLAELMSFKLQNSQYYIPSFDELLQLVGGKVPLLIEIKNSGRVGALEQKLIDTLSSYDGEFAIQSFNPYSLSYIKKRAPKFVLGLLACSFKDEKLAFYKKFILKRLFLLKKSGAKFINYDIKELPSKRVSKTGLPVLCWTARSQADFVASKSLARNIVFENFIPE